jgi:site-specific DNA recombinase
MHSNDYFVIYSRVSTQKQFLEGNSLETQIQRCRFAIKARFGDIPEENIINVSDHGYSGTTLVRPGIQRVIDLVIQKKVNFLVFFSLDRLSRKQVDVLNLLQMFQDNDVKIMSIHEPQLDTSSSMGSFFLSLLAGLCEFERIVFKDRVLRGKNRVKDLGGFQGGHIFGYLADKTEASGLKIVEAEAKIIKTIFYYRQRQKKGYLAIANALNDREFRKRDGKTWTARAVQRIIQHKSFYQGLSSLHQGQIPIHPRII